MSARPLPASGRAAVEAETLARLGLPVSASPEDVDKLHQAVSEFLAAAPTDVRGWAHAQLAALDSAYLTLIDPVGLEGSSLKSPARPPTVVPGGPATPPARRGPAPVAVAPAAVVAAIDDDPDAGADASPDAEPDPEALAALYASVTPSAHSDMAPDRRARPNKQQRRETRRQPAGTVRAPMPAAPATPNWWKVITLSGAALVAMFAIGFTANQVVNGAGAPGALANAASSPAPTQTPPSVDQAKVATLMQAYSANPTDVVTLLALGDEFYFGTQYAVAGTWYDKVLQIDPANVKALNAKGAVLYNTQDQAGAEATWKKTLAADANNVEAHFNLGFLYMNQATPDFVGVQREWNTVIGLDPASQFAQVAKAHLDSLVKASMIPAVTGSAAPSGSPATSPVPSAAASPAASAPASPAASSAPAGSAQP